MIEMRYEHCVHCAILFALPEAMFLARAEQKGDVWCPGCGKVNKPVTEGLEGAAAHLTTLALLAGARAELAEARKKIATMTPPPEKPIDGREVKRRSRILAARAESAEEGRAGRFGRKLCQFCGKSSANIQRHLFERHHEDLKLLSAETFE